MVFRKLLYLFIANLFLSGCSAVPEVQAWEREHFANPVMQRNSKPHQEALKQHTYVSKEGTQGGFSTGAGGCGCN